MVGIRLYGCTQYSCTYSVVPSAGTRYTAVDIKQINNYCIGRFLLVVTDPIGLL